MTILGQEHLYRDQVFIDSYPANEENYPRILQFNRTILTIENTLVRRNNHSGCIHLMFHEFHCSPPKFSSNLDQASAKFK